MKRSRLDRALAIARAKYGAYSGNVLPAAIFLLAFLFYSHNVRLLFPIASSTGGILIGDTNEITDTMRQLTYGDDMWKHLLFSATTAPLVSAFQVIFNIDQDGAIIMVLALIATLNIAGAFLLLRGLFSSTRSALLLTFLFASFFFNLYVFSIPETYALSDLLIIIYLSVLLKVREQLTLRNSLGLSFLAGLASLYNPPLLSLVIIHVIIRYSQSVGRSWIKLTVANFALAILVFLSANLLLQGPQFLVETIDYAFVAEPFDHESARFSLLNLLDWRNVANVFVNFFFYSILSPVSHLPGYLHLQDLPGYWKSPLRWSLLTIAASGVFYGIFAAITKNTKYQNLAWSLLAWISLMILFYTMFTPDDASLWALQILMPLLLVLAIAFRTIPARAHIRIGGVFLVGVLIALNNSLAFYAGPLP